MNIPINKSLERQKQSAIGSLNWSAPFLTKNKIDYNIRISEAQSREELMEILRDLEKEAKKGYLKLPPQADEEPLRPRILADGNPYGWAFVLLDKNTGEILDRRSGITLNQTHNFNERQALLKALEYSEKNPFINDKVETEVKVDSRVSFANAKKYIDKGKPKLKKKYRIRKVPRSEVELADLVIRSEILDNNPNDDVVFVEGYEEDEYEQLWVINSAD